jgi:hypothetical protein
VGSKRKQGLTARKLHDFLVSMGCFQKSVECRKNEIKRAVIECIEERRERNEQLTGLETRERWGR